MGFITVDVKLYADYLHNEVTFYGSMSFAKQLLSEK